MVSLGEKFLLPATIAGFSRLFPQICTMGKGAISTKRLVLCIWAMATATHMAAQYGTNPLIAYAGENLEQKINKHLFVEIKLNKQTAYEGESILADYQLYVAVDLEGRLTRSPSYVGFASYDVPVSDVNAFSVQQKGNVVYKVYTIKRVQLFGLEPGVQQLQPVELEASVRFRKDPIAYGGFAGDTIIPFTVRSSALPVKILPLPQPQPEGFSGAVGEFRLQAGIPADSQSANRTDAFVVQLSGKGNWHQVGLLPPAMPQGLTLYGPAMQDAIETNTVPLAGVKSWTYTVTAKQPGIYTIPAFRFVYFNPTVGSYTTLFADTFLLQLKNYSNPTDKPIPIEKKIAVTEVFSQWAVIVFPLTALLLALGLGYIWWHRKKTAVSAKQAAREAGVNYSGDSPFTEKEGQHFKNEEIAIKTTPATDRLQAFELHTTIKHWLQFASNAEHPGRTQCEKWCMQAEWLRYGPAANYEQEIKDLQANWDDFIQMQHPRQEEV